MKSKTTKAVGKDTPNPLVSRSFETFQWLGSWQESRLRQDEPYVWNGVVGVRKYRITIEPVDEPIEVLRQRVQALWDKCDNHHNWEPLQRAAASLGMERLDYRTVGKKGEAR
jgi:hypothetical protein